MIDFYRKLIDINRGHNFFLYLFRSINIDYYRLISIIGLSINYVWVYVTQGNFTTKLKPLDELKISEASEKWIPKAIELTSIPTHKKCKCKTFCSKRFKQGLVVKFYSSDVIVHKGFSERKEREERKKIHISSLERTYHIYSHKYPGVSK